MKPLLLVLLPLLSGFALAADAPKPIVLFDGKSIDDWEVVDIGGSGEVLLEEGALVIKMGRKRSRAAWCAT